MNTTDLTRFAFSTTFPFCQDAVREAMLELAGCKAKRKATTGKPVVPPKPYTPAIRRLDTNQREVLQLLSTRGPMDKAMLQATMTMRAPRLARTLLRLRDRGCIEEHTRAERKAYVWRITGIGRDVLTTGIAPPLPKTSRFSRGKKAVQG